MREPWNPIIRYVLKAIDEHNVMYFKTGNAWHLEKASALRAYIKEIKDWIRSREI
jgi:hypothetical protein